MNDMHERAIRKSDPRVLLEMLQRGTDEKWSPDELGDILQHQLRMPLSHNLDTGENSPRAAEPVAEYGSPPRTFGQLLACERPSLSHLQGGVKEFAKRQRTGADAALPAEVATVLYYTAIAAALLRRKTRITALTNEDLRRGLQWMLGLSWLDGAVRELATATLDWLGPSPPLKKAEKANRG